MKVGDANRAKAKRLEGPHVGRMTGGTGQFLGGVRAMAPLAVGDVLDGVAFGALATAVLGKLAPVVFSATAFSGSAQYATVSVLRAHGTPAAALLAAAALNIRYLAMSASVTATLGGPAIAFALVPWLPPGVPILAAGLAAGAWGWLR